MRTEEFTQMQTKLTHDKTHITHTSLFERIRRTPSKNKTQKYTTKQTQNTKKSTTITQTLGQGMLEAFNTQTQKNTQTLTNGTHGHKENRWKLWDNWTTLSDTHHHQYKPNNTQRKTNIIIFPHSHQIGSYKLL